jgi:V/A-type H+/Na+-transporting ATPase subunit I
MNSLGGFVHSIRLQFVEFFGKFYEGGGNKYEPFKEARIYTIIEGEIKGEEE